MEINKKFKDQKFLSRSRENTIFKKPQKNHQTLPKKEL